MAKRKTFEAILNESFKWPSRQDVPFRESEKLNQNAYIEPNGHYRPYAMMTGYKRAADILVDQALQDGEDRDLLIYTIVFSYRHYVELSLKFLIAKYGDVVSISPIWNTHDIRKLWRVFDQLLNLYGNEDPDEADADVQRIIAEFSKIDPLSFSLRYPVDTNGVMIPLSHERLDLNQLKYVMQGVENYFDGCDSFLGELRDASLP